MFATLFTLLQNKFYGRPLKRPGDETESWELAELEETSNNKNYVELSPE